MGLIEKLLIRSVSDRAEPPVRISSQVKEDADPIIKNTLLYLWGKIELSEMNECLIDVVKHLFVLWKTVFYDYDFVAQGFYGFSLRVSEYQPSLQRSPCRSRSLESDPFPVLKIQCGSGTLLFP